MLDIKFIRENSDLIKEAARKKHVAFDVEILLKVDDERRKTLAEVEILRAKQNGASDVISRTENPEEKEKLISEMRKLKGDLIEKEDILAKIQGKWEVLMLEVPNVPDPSVPEGDSDADNVEIRKWGEIPEFGFEPKSHIDLMEKFDLVDLERGVKVAGFRGYFLKQEAALLSVAIWQLAFEMWTKKGFIPLVAPSLVREGGLIGSGWLPQGKDEVYKTQDDLYLAGTAEVPVMALHQDEIFDGKELPKKYVAFSPCFRREAGSYGKDTKGIFRLHEFAKVEQVILCKADHQESVKWHEEITKNSEEIIQAIGIPHRVVVTCGGDLKLANVKTYDIEAWIPSEKRYRETHSSSYFHDFQARRLNIRYRDADGKVRFCHSLNNTAIATPRVLISLLENNQLEDGTIKIPEILQKYIGKRIIS